MKKRMVLTMTAGALFWGMASVGLAQETGFYVKADLGGNITQDVDVEDFFGENVSGVKLELDPGIRGGIAGGYQVTEWFAAELELGFIINEIDSVKGRPGFADDATLSNVPFLVNAKLQYPIPGTIVTPYAGAGVGGSQYVFDFDALQIGNTVVWGNDSETVFAWQAFAGLRFAMNERMGLALEYRYFDAGSPSWDAGFGEELSFGHARTHSLSLAFDFRF